MNPSRQQKTKPKAPKNKKCPKSGTKKCSCSKKQR